MRAKILFFVIAVTVFLVPFFVEAKVTEVVITSTESPTFEGLSFGSVGQYERLVGIARGEIDPSDPLNAGIVNIDKAPRNAQGKVEYDVDIYILKPVDMSKGNGKILYEVLNRGNKGAISRFNNGGGGNNPQTAEDAGIGFLMRKGYTILWSGWQVSYGIPGQSDAAGSRPATGGGRMLARFPIATNPGETPIVGQSREEFIVESNASPFVANLTYPAADIEEQASLTVRENQDDPRQTPAGMSWRYLNEWQIEITRPSSPAFDGGAIYEFIYPAKNSIVYGMAFASMRDVVSFFRYEVSDSLDNPNPLSPYIEKALGHGSSQSGRFLRDLIYEGFNQDESSRIVFDGANPHIAGSRKTWTNFEFSQVGRWSRQHEDHYMANDQFPFTYTTLYDPISGLTDGLLVKCQATGTCPKIMETFTDAEMWQARASLVVTDTMGNDITLPDNVRAYLFTDCQHSAASSTDPGIGKYLRNPLDYRPLSRAILVALDEWVTNGTIPPASRVPKRSDGTLVPSDQASTGFPNIPGVTYSGLYNWLQLTDYSVQPPAVGAFYPVFVSKVDSDGNGVTGIRLPDVEVPVATYTGWSLRAAGHAENELNSGNGSYFPFAQTEAERLATGDPRLSIKERYPNHGVYVSAVALAADNLVSERLLLQEDSVRIKEAAALSDIGK
jgi:hypothetical protein